MILRQKVSVRPDRFFLDGSTNIEPTRNINGDTVHGQWEYLKDDNEIKYISKSCPPVFLDGNKKKSLSL